MTSSITAATLTVTITEAVSLNGYDQGASNSLTISSINEVFKRIVTCPASNTTTLITFIVMYMVLQGHWTLKTQNILE